MHDPASWFRKTWFTRRHVRELKNAHNSVTVQNRTHVHMNFFHHKDLGNHLLQLCPKVVKHPVYNGVRGYDTVVRQIGINILVQQSASLFMGDDTRMS